MIGYMKPVKKMFSKEDRDLYQSIYCGLCRCLKYEYGYTGMATLNYEVVNTLLLVGAMDPSPFPQTVQSCSITPFYWRSMAGVNQAAFQAAAAVSITAAALEIQDNLYDSNKWYDRLIHSLINPKAEKTMQLFRADIESLRESYERFMFLESKAAAGDPSITFQMLTNASGDIIANAACVIGVHAGCQQLKDLFDVMHLWGQWIYLVDAIDDHDDDKRVGYFNPLFLADKPNSVFTLLEDIENHANSIIEGLVLRNYCSVVHALFRIHIPHRRRAILGKVNIVEIEGNRHDSSIQLEN